MKLPRLTYSLVPSGEVASESIGPWSSTNRRVTLWVSVLTTAMSLPAARYRLWPDPAASTPAAAKDTRPLTGTVTDATCFRVVAL